MKKLLGAFSILLLLAFLIACGGDSGTSKVTPPPANTVTDAFAFVTYTPTPGTVALARHSEVKGEHRNQQHSHFRAKGGLKPWDADIDPGPTSVMLMKNDGSGTTMVADQAGWFESVQLSLNGKKGSFTAESTSTSGTYLQAYVADMTQAPNYTIVQLTSDAEYHYMAQVSPDNKQIVFTKYSPLIQEEQAYLINVTGGQETAIPTPDTVDVVAPTFTADGKAIVFEDCNIDSINKINLDGTGMVVLNNADGLYLDDLPSVSPDGSKIVFIQSNEQGDNVYIMDITGQNLKQLTVDGTAWDPMFVKDKIVFLSWKDNPMGEIYSMNYDGSSPTRLTNNSSYEWFMEWD
ncbi:MAG TPA: hypothetical protein VFA68_12240 [Terriglobales bacterium]|nr:hypothetical protein [Terriglobales bacterium]